MVNSDEIRQNLGKNIKKLRKQKELSQEKLAEYIDMERESVHSIESGRAFVSADSLAKFANYFNVGPEYFFKQTPIEHFERDVNVKKEINRLLSGFNSDELILMYKIAAAIKK